MASTGGASGSPIFNREGRVVAVHNSGQQVTIGPEGKTTSIPYGTKAGMRIDLLKEVMR
jgi:V8-like Glu-specific endopeptidase